MQGIGIKPVPFYVTILHKIQSQTKITHWITKMNDEITIMLTLITKRDTIRAKRRGKICIQR